MADERSPASERGRLLRLLARYGVAVAGRKLAAPFVRPRPPFSGDGPLRAAFLAIYPEDHYGTVYRLSGWVPHLARRGIEVEVLCSTTEEEWQDFTSGDLDRVYRFHRASLRRVRQNIRRAARADVVLMHRGLLPFGPWQRPTFEKALVRANPRLVYDFYDSIWALRRGAPGRLARWLNPEGLVESLVGLARAVTVSNEHLAEWARPRHSDVRVIPMVIEPSDYAVVEHGPREPVTLGWMGGPWNRERLRSIAPALARASARTPLCLRTVSSAEIEIEGVEVESHTHPWSAESEAADLAAADVGLLPMFDDPEDRGKSPLKLLQYAAAGLPIVTSPVAVDFQVFRRGEALLVADTEEEWTEAVVSLARDPERRARLGAEARRVVTKHYSFEAHADAFADLLREVAGGNPLVDDHRPPLK